MECRDLADVSGGFLANRARFVSCLLQRGFEGFDAAVSQGEHRANAIAVIAGEFAWVTQERHTWGQIVILDVPVARPLLRCESRPPLDEHFPLAVCLATDRIVTRQKSDW